MSVYTRRKAKSKYKERFLWLEKASQEQSRERKRMNAYTYSRKTLLIFYFDILMVSTTGVYPCLH